jgi:hypothetical protein
MYCKRCKIVLEYLHRSEAGEKKKIRRSALRNEINQSGIIKIDKPYARLCVECMEELLVWMNPASASGPAPDSN